jgi:hypothetical protein
VLDYNEQRRSEAELTATVNQLSKIRAELEDQNKKGRLQTTLPTLQKEELKQKEKELVV